MCIMAKSLTILGSTGSIGKSALEVVRRYPDELDVIALSAHQNIDLLREQIAEFHPKYVAVTHEQSAKNLADELDDVSLFTGVNGLDEIASISADIVLCGLQSVETVTSLR